MMISREMTVGLSLCGSLMNAPVWCREADGWTGVERGGGHGELRGVSGRGGLGGSGFGLTGEVEDDDRQRDAGRAQ
jgi:hypothetical protein